MKSLSQMNVMVVFAVKYRISVFPKPFRQSLYDKLGIIINEYGCGSYPIAIGGTGDHVHIFLRLSPKIALETLVREIKSRSSRWLNNLPESRGRFEWQRGYGAFSYSQSARQNVIDYIANQEKHHERISFREEVDRFFALYGITPDPRDLPEELI